MLSSVKWSQSLKARLLLSSGPFPAHLLFQFDPLFNAHMLRHSPTLTHAQTHTPHTLSFLPSQGGRIPDRSMLKSQLNCAKAQLMGIGGGFPTCPSISHNASRIRLFLFRVVKPADTGPFCRSNRASFDVTRTTEVAWGEQLEKHTCAHTWQKAQKVDFCLESSSVIRTLAAESCRLWRVSQTDIEMLRGASSAGGMKSRSIPL